MNLLDSVPVIDMTRLEQDPATRHALDAACREWGFFQVTGHGVPRSAFAALDEQMRALFALPLADKLALERTSDNHWGFFDRELTKNRRDCKEIYDVGPAATEGPLAGSRPQWPAALPRFRGVIEDWARSAHMVADRLLAAIAANLGEPAAPLLADFGDGHTSFLRLNFYPVAADPEHALGIHEHTDSGALTVLLQDTQAGLQVLRDGHWYTVPPRADALVINIGDIVQVWSNDRYRAPVHRVLASRGATRYSAPYFYNPAASCRYAPLPGACRGTDGPHYQPINWGAFRAARAAGDYADQGEEIQIHHFRHGAHVPAVYVDAGAA
ncbi:MAG: hypothetical protein KF911_07190 [Pseudomonadales bacterium]|nr:hypothetical protein [Pseudomonadales bacterium]